MDERAALLERDPNTRIIQPVPRYGRQVLELARASLPISISFGLQNAVQAFSILMVGFLGTFELGVASYGYMFASCTGSMVAIGGATALDTLCGRAFTSPLRAANPHILDHYLQQGLLILSLLFAIFITPLWWFSGHLFAILGQEERFAMETGHFLRVLIPSGLLQVVAECLKKFLQVQGHSATVGWLVIVAAAFGILANFVLLRLANTGLWGAALANTVYHLATTILLLAFMAADEQARSFWKSFSKKSLLGSGRFITLSITGILTVATEWWSFEILAMMAARLDPISISTQSILMASDLIFTTVSLGLGVASSHQIAKSLGSGEPELARRLTRIPYLLSAVVGILEFAGLMVARNVYGRIFTDDASVIELTAEILPLMAGFQFLDLANGGAGGILRGAGKNHLSGFCNFIAYYGVGLTTAWYVCFTRGLGLFGLWFGIITGSLALLALQTICVATIRWDHMVAQEHLTET